MPVARCLAGLGVRKWLGGIAWGVSVWAGPAAAQWACVLTNEMCSTLCAKTTVSFAIDSNQFVAPHSPQDPPRRQVTTVTMNDATFVAEAIMMSGGVQGFHEDAGALGRRLMIVQPDGRARLSIQPQNIQLSGICTQPDEPTPN